MRILTAYKASAINNKKPYSIMDYLDYIKLMTLAIFMVMAYIGYRQQKTMNKDEIKKIRSRNFKMVSWVFIGTLFLLPVFFLFESETRKQILSGFTIVIFIGVFAELIRMLFVKNSTKMD